MTDDMSYTYSSAVDMCHPHLTCQHVERSNDADLSSPPQSSHVMNDMAIWNGPHLNFHRRCPLRIVRATTTAATVVSWAAEAKYVRPQLVGRENLRDRVQILVGREQFLLQTFRQLWSPVSFFLVLTCTQGNTTKLKLGTNVKEGVERSAGEAKFVTACRVRAAVG